MAQNLWNFRAKMDQCSLKKSQNETGFNKTRGLSLHEQVLLPRLTQNPTRGNAAKNDAKKSTKGW